MSQRKKYLINRKFQLRTAFSIIGVVSIIAAILISAIAISVFYNNGNINSILKIQDNIVEFLNSRISNLQDPVYKDTLENIAQRHSKNITLLNHTRHPEYHLPFRKGTQYYKATVLQGSCDKFCTSDFTYSLKAFNTIEEEPDAQNCLENYSEFKCHATLKQVLNHINEFVSN